MSQQKHAWITLETDPYLYDDDIDEGLVDNEPIVFPTIDSYQSRFQKMKAALVARHNKPYSI